MKLQFHHINLSTRNVPKMARFYDEILELSPAPDLGNARVRDEGYDGGVAFFEDNGVQFHVATRDLDVGHRTGHAVNPLERGHLAFRTDDIQAFKKRLDDAGIRYSDYGEWAMSGWYQIFFFDPDGNVIEVHQYNGDDQA